MAAMISSFPGDGCWHPGLSLPLVYLPLLVVVVRSELHWSVPSIVSSSDSVVSSHPCLSMIRVSMPPLYLPHTSLVILKTLPFSPACCIFCLACKVVYVEVTKGTMKGPLGEEDVAPWMTMERGHWKSAPPMILLLEGRSFHTKTLYSPNGRERDKNQIDHLMINRMWRWSLLDVQERRGADVGSDHHLATGSSLRGWQHFGVEKLWDLKVKTAFILQI